MYTPIAQRETEKKIGYIPVAQRTTGYTPVSAREPMPFSLDTDTFGVQTTTPQITRGGILTPVKALGGFAKEVGQSIARNIGSAGLTLAKPSPKEVAEPLKSTDFESPFAQSLFETVFGKGEEIKPIETRIAEGEPKVKEWGEELDVIATNPDLNTRERLVVKSLSKLTKSNPETLAFLGIMGSVGLDLTPFGGLEKGVWRAMVKAKTVGEAMSVLTKMRVADDLVRQFAPDVVKVVDEKSAKALLNNIANLQKTTKAVGELPVLPKLKMEKPLIKRPPSVAKILRKEPAPFIKKRETTLLKAKIKEQAKGARVGFRVGKEIERGIQKTITKQKIGEVVRKGEIKGLKENILVRARKDKIIERILAKKEEISTIKKDIYQFTKEALPLEKRGKLLASITSAETHGDLASAFRRIVVERNKIFRKEAVSSIEKKVVDIEKIPIKWQDKIMAEMEGISFKGMTDATVEKLTKLRDFLTREPEAKFLFGRKTLAEMKAIKRLEQVPISEKPIKDLIKLEAKITKHFEEGKLAEKVIKETEVLRQEKLLKGLEKTSNNIDKKLPRTIGIKQTRKEKLGNARYQIADQMHKGYMNYVSIDVGFEILDNNVRNGLNYRTFKVPFDEVFFNYKQMSSKIVDDYFNFKKPLEAKYGKLEEFNFERVMIHATTMQEGGRAKLIKSGLEEKLIDSIKLNEAEKEVYEYMRNVFDEMHPYIDNTLQKTHKRKLGKVDNYFSWQTDFNNSDEIFKKLEGDYLLTSRTQAGFTKERTLVGKQVVRLNAEDVFLKHINDTSYFIHTEDVLNHIGKIARAEDYYKAVGKNGQKWVVDWIDLMARKGIPEGYKPTIINRLLRNVGSGILGFRISPIAKQPIAKITSSALLGKHAFKYDPEFYANRLWNYVQDASKQQKFRTFDDPAYTELAKNKKLAQWQEWGYQGIKWVDQFTADSTWYASYRRYFSDKGISFSMSDFKAGNINKEALEYANYIVRRTQGSGETKDLARMLTDKRKNIFKAFLQFQSFILNESYLIPHDTINVAIRTEKDYGKAMGIITAWIVAGLAEEYIATGISQLFSSKQYAEKQREEKFLNKMFDAIISKIPFINNIYNMYKYEGAGVAILDLPQTIIKGSKSLVEGKKPETKIKGATRMMEAIMQGTGIAGAGQFWQAIRRYAIPETTDKKPSIMPSLPALPKLPKLPKF